MKGGKEEEKMTSSPMFPRLHVNDTDKGGGPRAPPRNKMALYEQLSIPSHRFNHSSLPPPQNARNLVAPSSCQGNGHEGTIFSPFYTPPSAPAYAAEKRNSRSSDGENIITTKMETERRSTYHVNIKPSNAIRSVAECSSSKLDFSNIKSSCRKRVDDDDDFRVPTFVNPENVLYLNKETSHIDKRRQANSPRNSCPATLNVSVQLAGSCDRPLETNISDSSSVEHERRHNKQKASDAIVMEDQTEKFLSRTGAGENLAEPSRLAAPSSDRKLPGDLGVCQESCGNGALDRPVARIESQFKASFTHKDATAVDICARKSDDEEDRSLDEKDADKNDETSDMSMVDPISGLDISPDDVVGVIGPKQFWKARRAIVNQQRVFALQVFELHRLLKVQKLLAASPHLLLEENSCVTSQKPQAQTVRQEEDVSDNPNPSPNQNMDDQTESTGISPLPVDNPNPSQTGRPYSGSAPPLLTPDNRLTPWSFQPPPTHQWLVPVMSPSEGLIYKPYSGPCPPPAGFMAPLFGNYNPMNPPGASSIAPSYMPTPYGVPSINPVNLQTEPNSHSSCNITFPKSNAKIHASKDNELRGSTSSSPCERARGGGRDALHLFPIAPDVEASAWPSRSDDKEHRTRVIRVVPRHARSATESAARIFRSIQEERQQLEQ